MNKRLDGEATRMKANAKQVKAEMKAQTAAITAALESAREAAQSELRATSVSSVARYNSVIKAVEDGVAAARKKANNQFNEVQITMAKDREDADKNLAGAVSKLNDSIAKASALETKNFKNTVKDLGAARKAAADDVKDAKKEMLMGLSKVQANAKAVESRIIGQIEAVAATILSDKAEQGRINNKVDGEMSRILKLSDSNQVEDKRARGVIRKVMEENKRIAHEEVVALGKEARLTLKAVNSEQNNFLSGFKSDLTSATMKVYREMAKDKKAQESANAALKVSQGEAVAQTAGALKAAKKQFKSRFMSLNNAVIANQKSYKRKMDKATGVVSDWKKASTTDRKLIREERGIMETKLRASIVRAIQVGEAKMKKVEERAMENIATEKKTLMTTISVAVENMADNIFATVQGDRQKIADNFLSLKAYAAAAADKVLVYVGEGKGRNLSSIGDLLQTLAGSSSIKPEETLGEGFGAKEVKAPFSNKKVKVNNSITKINGLVNQYISSLAQVKDRWPMGLGKYLIAKLEVAMQGKGALEVDKIVGQAGNYVFINGHAVGLSSKLSDFESLAVSMSSYESILAKFTAENAFGKKAHTKIDVKPPQWQGN